MPRKSHKKDDDSKKLINIIFKLPKFYLGNAVIFLEEFKNELKNSNIEKLKLIAKFFMYFDNDHEIKDWIKLLTTKEDMVCIMYSTIITLYIHKERLCKISEYFNIILNGSFQKNYCKLNNLYFIYIENN
jgi:hypothetical protein